MGDPAAAAHPEARVIELGSLAGRYSTADDALPWWVSAPVLCAGVAVWLLFGTEGWVYYLGYAMFGMGVFMLTERYVLRATTEVTPHGLNLRGFYGRRVQVPWSVVVDVLPSRLPSGRSRVRLSDGRRVLMGGVPAVKARRLREALRHAGAAGEA